MDMSHQPKPINWFAVTGLSLGISLVLIGAGYITYFSSNSSNNYGSAHDLAMLAFTVLALVLFICLPILLGSKFGWRTVLTTVVVQSLLLSLVAFGVSLATNSSEPEPSPYYGGSIMNGVNSAVTDQKAN